eukprot:3932785-Pleurochrysis_carterae.AAC.11
MGRDAVYQYTSSAWITVNSYNMSKIGAAGIGQFRHSLGGGRKSSPYLAVCACSTYGHRNLGFFTYEYNPKKARTRSPRPYNSAAMLHEAGIYYIWDPMKIQVSNIEEIYPSRVARAAIHHLDSGNKLTVYGVYMPVRNNNGERIEEIWGK